MDKSIIDRYESQAGAMKRWIAGLSHEELVIHPVPSTWSIQQLVIHMYDSDMVATHRLRRIVGEDNPLLIAYDETMLADRLPNDQTSVQLAAEAFDVNRRFTASFLRALPPGAFMRTGVHNQRGKVTAEEIVKLYVGHVDHHEPFLVEKRSVLGKPMAG